MKRKTEKMDTSNIIKAPKNIKVVTNSQGQKRYIVIKKR